MELNSQIPFLLVFYDRQKPVQNHTQSFQPLQCCHLLQQFFSSLFLTVLQHLCICRNFYQWGLHPSQHLFQLLPKSLVEFQLVSITSLKVEHFLKNKITSISTFGSSICSSSESEIGTAKSVSPVVSSSLSMYSKIRISWSYFYWIFFTILICRSEPFLSSG